MIKTKRIFLLLETESESLNDFLINHIEIGKDKHIYNY